MKRRVAAAALLTVVAVFVSACTGFQTKGEVSAGLAVDEQIAEEVPIFTPDSPQAGASPEEIVSGFIRAASSPSDSWKIARQFLAQTFENEWDPRTATLIDDSSGRSVEVDAPAPDDADPGTTPPTPTEPAIGAAATVKVSTMPNAMLNDIGVYSTPEPANTTLRFDLEVQEDGQWRIIAAPPGVLIDSITFSQVYAQYNLMFFDPTWSTLVPDARWYPAVTARGDVVNGLIAGPSPWLAGSVSSAVPDGARSSAFLPVEDSTARVTLSGIDNMEATAVGRLKLQLLKSLANAGVRSLELSSTTTGVMTAPPATYRAPTVDNRALVLDDESFGFRQPGGVDPVSDIAASLQGFPVRAVEVSVASGQGVALSSTGEVVRIQGDAPLSTVDVRPGLVSPTIGPSGDIWTVPGDVPTGLQITMIGGAAVNLPEVFDHLQTITAMQVSRDGTRIAVAGTIGSEATLQVFAIQRDSNSVPIGLSDPVVLRTLKGSAEDLTWVDQLTIGVVVPGDSDTTIVMQPVGAPAVTSTAASDIVTIAGGSSSSSSVWLLSASGELFSARGSTWARETTGISLLAHQQAPGSR